MNIGKWMKATLAAPFLLGCMAVGLTGCGDFWQAPGGSSGSFTLSNSGNISTTPGGATSNTSTVTVTPASSFTGTVTLSCAVTSSPSSATSPATCSLDQTSLTFSADTAQTATLTATTQTNTTLGAYQITVTGASSGVTSETTTVCAEVSTSGTATCSSASGASGAFYVLNQGTNQIVALSISSGALNTIGTYTLPTAQATAITVAPNGQFLYVATSDGISGAIYLYTIGSGGALTLGNSGAAISSDPATTMQVDSTNSWLVDAVSGSTQLAAIAIDPSTGLLAAAQETEQLFPGGLPASTPAQLAISPGDSSSCTNCYVFVAMGAGGFAAIHFNPGSANPFGTHGFFNVLHSGGDNAVAVDPTNRLVYVGESDALPSATQTAGLRVRSITATDVPEITGSPYPIQGTGPTSILPTADGNYVYVANRSVSGISTGNIAGFSVTSTALTSLGAAVAAGPAGQIGLAEDSTASYVLAVDSAGDPDLQVYTLSSGTLTSLLTAATGTGNVDPIAIAAVP